MARKSVAHHITSFPWASPKDAPIAEADSLTRAFLILPFDSSSEVICEETQEPLPIVSLWRDKFGEAWSKFELPRGEAVNNLTQVHFTNSQRNEQYTIEIPLGSGISRRVLDEELDTEDQIPISLEKLLRIRNFIDQHIQFMNDLNDNVRSNRLYWEGNCGGKQIRSMYRATSRWLKSDDKDHARLALIVKLARDIGRTLGQVCERPRVVLRRTRELQSISRIQEVDAACLRWIARQPGRDIYERAGARQQLLGVIRKEDTDTLENRVVRDLLHRARIECSNYMSIYREYPMHDRVRTVSGFRQRIHDWEKNSEIRGAKPLSGPAQPNYVLLHEPKYRKLWEAYQMLLSQQKQKDNIWKWRDRTFAESCQFLVLSAISRISDRSPFFKSDLELRHEAISGTFVSDRSQIGAASLRFLNRLQHIVYCSGSRAKNCSFIDRSFLPLSADFFVVYPRIQSEPLIIPFWCFTDLDSNTFRDGLNILERKVRTLSCGKNVYPVIITFRNSSVLDDFLDGRGRVLSLSNSAQEHVDAVQDLLLSILEKS